MAERTHACPGGCGRTIPNRMFACVADWKALPRDLQRAIQRTARLSLSRPDRLEAVTAAIDWYAARAAAREAGRRA